MISGAVQSVPWVLFWDCCLSGLFFGYGVTSTFAPTAKNESTIVTADVIPTLLFELPNVTFGMNCIEHLPEGSIHYGLSKPSSLCLDTLSTLAVAGSSRMLYKRPYLLQQRTARSTEKRRRSIGVIRPPVFHPLEKDFLRRCVKCGKMHDALSDQRNRACFAGGGSRGFMDDISNQTGLATASTTARSAVMYAELKGSQSDHGL